MGKRAYLGIISLAFVLVSISVAFAQVPAAVADVGDLFANNILAIGIFAFFIALIDGYIIGMLRARGVPVRAEVHYAIMGVLIIVFILSLLSSFAGVELPPFVGTLSFAIVVIALIPTGWDGAQVAGLKAMERSPVLFTGEQLREEAREARRLGDTKRAQALEGMAKTAVDERARLEAAKKAAAAAGDVEAVQQIEEAEHEEVEEMKDAAALGEMTTVAEEAGAGKGQIGAAEKVMEQTAVKLAKDKELILTEAIKKYEAEVKELHQKMGMTNDKEELKRLGARSTDFEVELWNLRKALEDEKRAEAEIKLLPKMEAALYKEEIAAKEAAERKAEEEKKRAAGQAEKDFEGSQF